VAAYHIHNKTVKEKEVLILKHKKILSVIHSVWNGLPEKSNMDFVRNGNQCHLMEDWMPF
jgi:hypothetical protein